MIRRCASEQDRTMLSNDAKRSRIYCAGLLDISNVVFPPFWPFRGSITTSRQHTK